MASHLFDSRPQQPASISAPTGPSAGVVSPTIVMPQDWNVPSYLKHSVFYSRFTVSPATLSPVASASGAHTADAYTGGSAIDTTGSIARWGSSTALHGSSRDINTTLPVTGVRLPSEATSARERYQECLDNPNAKIPLPSKLDPKHCCKRLFIQDGMVQFCPEKDDQGRDKLNRHDPEKDAAAVRADYPIPPQAGIYYFEVEIVSKGQKGYIGIGFSSRAVDLERLPGWNPESYGYHGDDGKAFACSGTGQAYSERFGSGDVIGCGIDFVAKKAFFVKNGKWLGYVFDLSSQICERVDPNLRPNFGAGNGITRRDRERGKLKETPGTAPLQYYPTVGLQTPGETVKVNFGQQPFKFDIESFVKRRQKETTATTLRHSIPSTYKQALAPSFPSLPFLVTGGTSTGGPQPGDIEASDPVARDNDDPHVKACMQNLIASYLNYRGYSDTARSFRSQREEERQQWRAVVADSSASFAAASADSNGDPPSSGPSGTTTPAKKKGKKKAENGSKKLLKSVLRTTLSASTEAGDSQMDAEDSQMRMGPSGDENEEMQAKREGSSISTAKPSRSLSAQDDYMTSDAKHSISNMYDLEADEAELEDTLRRQNICSALRRGRIDYALQQIQNYYSGVIYPSARDSEGPTHNGTESCDEEEANHRRADLLFRLRCCKFVELVLACTAVSEEDPSDSPMETEQEDDEDDQVASQLIFPSGASPHASSAGLTPHTSSKGNGEADYAALGERPEVSFEDVLSYGSQLNSLYPATNHQTPPHVLSKLKLLFSLVAYANPADLASHGNKAIYELTRQEERDKLAEDVNKAMLESKGQPGLPHLELIYRQAHAVRDVLGDVFGIGQSALVGSITDV